MKSIRFSGLLLFLVIMITVQLQHGLQASRSATQNQSENLEAARADMEEGIKHLLVAQVEAWNRGDLEGFMAGYWNSPDLTFYSGGLVVSGWSPTLERYRNRYQSEGREMGKLDFNDLRIEMLGPASAFVRGKFHLKMSSGEQGGLFTLTFRKLPEGWKIIHDHTSTP